MAGKAIGPSSFHVLSVFCQLTPSARMVRERMSLVASAEGEAIVWSS